MVSISFCFFQVRKQSVYLSVNLWAGRSHVTSQKVWKQWVLYFLHIVEHSSVRYLLWLLKLFHAYHFWRVPWCCYGVLDEYCYIFSPFEAPATAKIILMPVFQPFPLCILLHISQLMYCLVYGGSIPDKLYRRNPNIIENYA